MLVLNRLGAIVRAGLFRSASVYMGTSLLNAAIPFLMMPLLTRWLDRQDYGRAAMFQVAVNVASLFTGLSVESSIARIFFERSGEKMSVYLGNCLLILACSTLMVCLGFAPFSSSIGEMLELPIAALWLVLAVAASRFVTNAALTIWQVRNEPGKYSLFQIGQSLFTLALTLLFVQASGLGWWGIAYAQCCGGLAFALISLWFLHREPGIKWNIDWPEWRAALAFGLPLIPHSLGGLAIGMTDRIAISNMISLEAAGVYVVGVQVGMGINLIQSSFNTAWTPWLFGRLQKNSFEDKLAVVRVVYVYSVSILVAAGLLGACAPVIFQLLIGKEFQGAARYVPWVALGFALNGMYKMVGGMLLYAKRTGWMAGITVASGVLNVAATILCVGKWGAVGAAYAIPISFGFLFVMTWIASTRCVELPWSLRQVLTPRRLTT